MTIKTNDQPRDWFGRRAIDFWVSGAAILAFILRLWAIQQDSLWIDEAISYLTAALPLPLILNNTIQSSHPPLYYLLLHYWLPLWPDSDLFPRLFSLFWGMLFLPVLYWLTFEIVRDRRLALLALIFAAVSPFHVLYSNELRMYTQLLFFIALAAGAYLQGKRTGRLRWRLLFGGAGLAALYTHLFTIFFLGAVGLHAILKRQDRWTLWFTAGAGLFITVLFIPWLAVLAAEAQAELGSLRPLAADVSLLAFDPVKPLTVLNFLLFGLSFTVVYAGAALFLTLAFVVVTVLELLKAYRREEDAPILFAAGMVLIIIGLPIVIYYWRPFFLPERALAGALPFFFVLLSWGAARRKTPLPLLSYAALALMLAGTLLYLQSDSLKSPYREAMLYLADEWQAGDTAVHTSDFSYMPALRYVRLPQHFLLKGEPGSLKPETVHEALGGGQRTRAEIEAIGGRVWLIVALVDNLEWQKEQADYFAANHTQLDRRNIGGIEIFLYQLAPSP
jgi:hypothetical protein